MLAGHITYIGGGPLGLSERWAGGSNPTRPPQSLLLVVATGPLICYINIDQTAMDGANNYAH